MKTTIMLSLVLIIIAMLLVGCGTKEITAPVNGKGGSTVVLDEVNSGKEIQYYTYEIHAGNANTIAGTITVWNDLENVYVEYQTTGGWMLEQTHTHLAATWNDVPLAGNGQPIPGQFDYQSSHNPMVTYYLQTIPLSEYNFVCDQEIIVLAHCSVWKGSQQETGWGGNLEGGDPRWYWYLHYSIQCPDDDDEDVFMEETAMVRMYDSPTDFTYRWVMGNGKNHPWFSYVKTYPVLAPQTYYFYAGQSAKAGEVQIWKEGDFLKVQLDMMNTWQVTGTHLNVSLQGFVGPPAFGLFPYSADHSPFATTFTYSVPWNTAWDGMQLNVALHGDARKPVPPSRH